MASRVFPIGTPLTVVWHFSKPDGTTFDLSGYTYRVYYRTGNRQTEVNSTHLTAYGNMLTVVIPADMQYAPGEYSLKLVLYQNSSIFCTLVYNVAFVLSQQMSGDPTTETQSEGGNTVHLYTVAEFYMFSPVVPTVGNDGYWYVNGNKISDGNGEYIPSSHTVEYDPTTNRIIIDRGRVNQQGQSIAQVITSLADALGIASQSHDTAAQDHARAETDHDNAGGDHTTAQSDHEAIQQLIEQYEPIVINGDVTNAPDEEDITSDENDLLKFKDRGVIYGMGYCILRRNKTFAEQVTKINTIYEIRYDFDLDGESVTIPEKCELRFNGGSLNNGTCVFDISTIISGNPKIYCDVEGLLSKADITWFGAEADYEPGDIAPCINKASSISSHIVIPNGTFYIKTAATVAITASYYTIDWYGDLIYNGTANEIDVFTIKRDTGVACTLNMTGTLTGRNVVKTTANRFKVKGLVVQNISGSQLFVGTIAGFNVGLMLIGKGAGCQNNNIYLSLIMNCNEGLLITQDNVGTAIGWANENLFVGGKITVSSDWDLDSCAANFIYISSLSETDTYNKVNCLTFIKPNLECALSAVIPIYAKNWYDSTIYKARFENIHTIAKLVDNCGRLDITSQYYKTITIYDLSELAAGTTITPLFINIDYRAVYSISPMSCAGVHVGSEVYSSSPVFRASISSSDVVLVDNSPVLLDVNNQIGNWGIQVTFSESVSYDEYNMIELAVQNGTANRKNVYVKCTELFDGSAVDNSKIFVRYNTVYNRGNFWGSGNDGNFYFFVFDKKVKTIILMFSNIDAVLLKSRYSCSLATQSLLLSGDTRPAYKYVGYQFFDTTLGKMICWNGTAWVNLDGTALE